MTLPSDRHAGACLHLTSLPGKYGIGTIGQSALGFIDQLVSMGLKVWQFLPTGPTAYGDSPYQPLSTFAGNPLLIDVDYLVRLGLVSQSEADRLSDLPVERVEYGRLIPLKTGLLGKAAERFDLRASPELKANYDEYLELNDQSWLHDYALFRMLKTRHDERAWPQWEEAFVTRSPHALRRITESARAELHGVKVGQFLFYHQWQTLRRYARQNDICLFGDLPIYIALDSADAWAHPELLRIDRRGQPTGVAGVPPDYFSADGQLWGNPLYDWQHHAATGYEWWIERLRHSIGLADIIRIDHFRGFESYWAVAAESPTAREGAWEPGPGDAIFDAMRAALGNLPIVAEDLGVITEQVEALRDRQSIPGMKVLQFMADRLDFDLAEIGENCVCYTGTHDNDTTLGWFQGGPGDVRTAEEIEAMQKAVLANTNGRADSIHHDLIRLAFASAARTAIAPVQDYLGLGSEARLNTPGVPSNNWCWRLLPGHITAEVCESVLSMVSDSSRHL